MSTNTALDQIKNRVRNATPGPWQNNAPGVCCPGVCIDSRNGDVQHNMEPIRWADAELIAAAPKLLAALEAVQALANNWQKTGERPDMFDAALHHAAIKLHAAITEALR